MAPESPVSCAYGPYSREMGCFKRYYNRHDGKTAVITCLVGQREKQGGIYDQASTPHRPN